MRNNIFVGVAVVLSLSIAFAAGGEQDLVIDSFDVALAEAARDNNFPEFDRLYQRNPMPAYAELHRLWTWAMNDPVGGFYGRDTYERLAGAYPGYEDFIAEYRIVDSNQNVFFPTAETRTFLLSQAIRGVVAEFRPAKREVAAAKVEKTAVAPKVVVPAPESKPVTMVAPVVEAPPLTQPAPLETAAVQKSLKAPEVTPRVAPAPAPIRQSRSARNGNDLGRGIFLIIAGLLGVGMVSLMLHTAPEEREVTHT